MELEFKRRFYYNFLMSESLIDVRDIELAGESDVCQFYWIENSKNRT